MRRIDRPPMGELLLPLEDCRISRIGIGAETVLTLRGPQGLEAEIAVEGPLLAEDSDGVLRLGAGSGERDDLAAITDLILWQTTAHVTASPQGAVQIVLGNAVIVSAASDGLSRWRIADNCGLVVDAQGGALMHATDPDRDPPEAGVIAPIAGDTTAPGAALLAEPEPRWFAVRCIIEVRFQEYEERITLWCATDADEAIALAEDEAARYMETLGPDADGSGYLGLAQEYDVEAPAPLSGTVVYSLTRDSDLPADDYVAQFFDTGTEKYDSVDDESDESVAESS